MNRFVPALFAASLLASGAAFAQNTNGSAVGNTAATPGAMNTPTTPPGTTSTTTPNAMAPGSPAVIPPRAGTMGAAGMNPTPGTAPNGTNPGAMTTNGNPAAVTTTGSASRTTKAPVPGANSFTMGQARSRIRARGFTKVTGLHKDNQGIWRGKAMKNGQSVSVSLDYQGNIVSK